MTRASARLLAAACCVWLAAIGGALRVDARRAQDPVSSAAPGSRPSAGDQYVGSAACARCHDAEYDAWKKTLHVQMTKPIADAVVVGDFRPGTHLEAYNRSYRMETKNGRYYITVTWGNEPPTTYEVHYTLGARRFQGYLSKLPDGRIYVLPVFWHNETRRWIDWREITPVAADATHVRQIWNVECVNCHATNLVKNYDVDKNTYATTWTEMGIGCEACHGPGAAHVAKMDEWQKRPRGVPAYDGSASNRELSRILEIFSPRTAEPRRVFDTCGYCHGNKTNKFFGFRPGDKYEDFAIPFLASEPLPANDPQGDFWPDGRPSRFNRPQALTLSGCFMRGTITCTNCHVAHSAKNEHALKVPVRANGKITRQSDALCTQCHGANAGGSGAARRDAQDASATPSGERATAYGATAVPPAPIPDLQAHTHHQPDSPGSRCVECHMSDVNWRLFTRRRDHTFRPPVPEMTASFGVGNACNTCHDDKSPEWAARQMDEWYGNADARRATVAMAEAFYRAGSGDPTVVGDLARYAVDRRSGALIRASAADFVAQLLVRRPPNAAKSVDGASTAPAHAAPAPAEAPTAEHRVPAAVVNAMIGAAADPEPMVRASALRALAATLAPQATTVVASHLADAERVVRVSAAQALFALGVLKLDGPPMAALARAQSEWMASLATFADVPADHTTLGWLMAETGRTEDGLKELRTAARMDPASPQPQVYLGILAARAGRYAEALRCFKTAKSLDPAYANLDRLIDHAQKLISTGRN